MTSLSNSSDYLFVYGTLCKSAPDSRNEYLAADSEFIDSATIPGHLYFVENPEFEHGFEFDQFEYVDSYPALVLENNKQNVSNLVRGEVYEIKNHARLFAKLDDYEGCTPDYPEPHEYKRCIQTVTLSNGAIVDAWVYEFIGPIRQLTEISDGDFVKFKKGKIKNE